MTSGVRTVADGFQEYVSWATDPVPRIPMGLPFFDLHTGGGIARSEICMVMAYSSVGKTSLALNIIRANPHIPTLFFSLEMSWRQVVARLAAMHHGTTTRAIEEETKLNGFNRHAKDTADFYRGLVCDDSSETSLKDAKASFARATEILGTPPRLVIWDYLELIGGSGLLQKTEAVDRAAQKLRAWTRDLDTSTYVLHQVGKGDEGGGYKPLALDSGRYGGHQPMDMVVGAYAPRLERGLSEQDYERLEPELYLQLLKNRAGSAKPVGKKYRQDPRTMRISPWDQAAYIPGTDQPLPFSAPGQVLSSVPSFTPPAGGFGVYGDEEPF
jgi:replicative DNA helicase